MANGPASTETRHLRTLFALGAAGTLTDGQLLERFATRDGDPAELAFAALVERHGPMVLRVARSTLLDEPSAHDAFQATFLILARKARSLWVRDSLGPWLHAVAFRVANHSRALEARRRRHERAASRPEAHDPRDGSRDDLARAIHEEIERLPEPYRAAIVTCHLEGLTQQDAAHRLGWPVGTLQSRLARGRQRLRDRLRRRGLAPSIGVLAGKLAPVPNALLASTAKAAVTLNIGGAITGMIAPAVLAMIETTTKGMLMTKLKLGAVALVMMGGLVGSGVGRGVGRHVKATQGPVVEATQAKPVEVDATAPTAILEPVLQTSRQRGQTPPPTADVVLPPLVDPVTDIRPPGFPVLLNFYADWSGPCRQMRPEIERLARQRYPVTSVPIDGPSELVDRYRVTAVPTYILVDDSGRELGRTAGAMPASKLAEFYNETWKKSPKPDRSDEEPALTNHSNPKPWETVVRIKMQFSDSEWGFGSGTIISSSAEESIILTCGRIFRLKGQASQPPPVHFRVPIKVDLFDGRIVRDRPATLGREENDIPGEVIDYDFPTNLGLIRIRPGRKLPASMVVPTSWHPQKGMEMYAVGCSHGQDATAWDTTILDPRVGMRNTSTEKSFAAIKCANRPKEGRSGGGLYTSDGYLAGVCAFADPNEDAGFYAPPEAIHRLLDRNGLSSLYSGMATGGLRSGPVDPTQVPTIIRGQPRGEEVDIDGQKHHSPSSLLASGGKAPSKADSEPVPPRAVSDQDRRLDDLERKLDQVLKALEELKGDAPEIKGGFPDRKRIVPIR